LLKRQIADYRRLVTVNDAQAAINADEFRNVEIKYQADRRLYDEKVYGRLEFLREENAYLQKKKENETYRRTAIENSLTLSEREKQITRAGIRLSTKIPYLSGCHPAIISQY